MEMEKDSKKITNEIRDWSSLPLEIVELISKRLSVADQVHMGCVCVPWFCSTINKFNIWVPQTPWLIENSGGSSQFLCFNNTYQKYFRIYKPFRSSHGSCILGSFRGWLFILNKGTTFILNPLSRIKVQLPPITAMCFTSPNPIHSTRIMIIPFAFSIISTCQKLNPITIMKVTCFGELAWCNIGDTSWKTYVSEVETKYGNIISFNDKIYAITQDGGRVDIFNKPNNESLVLLNSTPHYPIYNPRLIRVYLVECGGKLLVVKRFFTSRIETLTAMFFIFEIQESSNGSQLVNTFTLEDHILFLAGNSIESVHSKHCPRLRSNCIYYIDYSLNFNTGFGLWEFSVLDRTMTQMPFSHAALFPSPFWVLPRFASECDSNCECNYSKWGKRKRTRPKSQLLQTNVL